MVECTVAQSGHISAAFHVVAEVAGCGWSLSDLLMPVLLESHFWCCLYIPVCTCMSWCTVIITVLMHGLAGVSFLILTCMHVLGIIQSKMAASACCKVTNGWTFAGMVGGAIILACMCHS